MFSTATWVACGISGTIGMGLGGAFVNAEGVNRKDSLTMKIAKIAAGAIMCGTLLGILPLGIVTVAAKRGGLVSLILVISLTVLKISMA